LLKTHPVSQRDIDLCNTSSGHGRGCVVPAKLFYKCWNERCITLEVVELGRILEKSYNSLIIRQEIPS